MRAQEKEQKMIFTHMKLYFHVFLLFHYQVRIRRHGGKQRGFAGKTRRQWEIYLRSIWINSWSKRMEISCLVFNVLIK
jgi:hypothetical protein